MSWLLERKSNANVGEGEAERDLLQRLLRNRNWGIQHPQSPSDALEFRWDEASRNPSLSWRGLLAINESNLPRSSPEICEQRLAMPHKLFAILESPSYSHIITWLPGGKVWMILNLEAFVKDVLPLYFDYGHRNLSMFARLLKLWNFCPCEVVGPNAYYHQLFIQGAPQLLRLMRPSESLALSPPREKPSEGVLVHDREEPKQTMSPPDKRLGGALSLTSVIHTQDAEVGKMRGLTIPCRSTAAPLFPSIDRSPPSCRLTPKTAKCTWPFEDLVGGRIFTANTCHNDTLHKLETAHSVDRSDAHRLDAYLLQTTLNSSTLPAAVKENPQPVPASLETTQPETKAPPLANNNKPTPKPATKKQRRKWLPPLGPPSSKTSSSTNETSTFMDSSNCDWLCTNPEVFASLANAEVSPSNFAFP